MILKHARVLPQLTPGWGGEFADIVLNGSRIEEILPAGTAAGESVDLAGKTVLPGFIDAHVHLDLSGADVWQENNQTDATRTLKALHRANASLRSGFTTLRDLGDRNNIVVDLAAAIAQGDVFGPDIIASGVILTPSENGNEYFQGLYAEADGCNEVLKATRKQIQRGAQWIKYMGTGAFMNPGGEPGNLIYTQEEVDTMVRTAAMHKIPVAGHNHGEEGILTAIRAGVRTIEHSTMMNEEIMNLVKDSTTTFLVPTLAPDAGWESQTVPDFYLTESQLHMIEGQYERYHKAYKMGLKLGYGTDAGAFANSHGNNTLEFKERVSKAEMAPLDVLLQMTLHNAEILMLDHEVGTLEPGKKANIVAIDGKPDLCQADIGKVAMVIKDGSMVR